MDKETLQEIEQMLFNAKIAARKDSLEKIDGDMYRYMYLRGKYHALSELWHEIDSLLSK